MNERLVLDRLAALKQCEKIVELWTRIVTILLSLQLFHKYQQIAMVLRIKKRCSNNLQLKRFQSYKRFGDGNQKHF